MTAIKPLLALALLVWAQSVLAQPRPPIDRGMDPQARRPQRAEQLGPRVPREQLAKRIKQLQMWKLTERLNLSDEQAAKFFPRYNRYQDELGEAMQNLQNRVERLRELRRSDANENELDREIEAVVRERKNVSDVLPKYLKEFRETLTAQQMADLIIFERDFLRDLTEAIERARERAEP
ncbi:MAG: hypothetical protein NZM06_03210 [Chloroherpetonaceae bacterium]|nr:hypothetical protein [Chloroherpetonaceae bacterium]MDW8436986.1 hypothetical protein [Chloroherpetonaceae bacterium]